MLRYALFLLLLAATIAHAAPLTVPARDVRVEGLEDNNVFLPNSNNVQSMADFLESNWPTSSAAIDALVALNTQAYLAGANAIIAAQSNSLITLTNDVAAAQAYAAAASNFAAGASNYAEYTYTQVTSLLSMATGVFDLVAASNAVVQGIVQGHNIYVGSNVFEIPPNVGTSTLGAGTESNAVNVNAAISIARTEISNAAPTATAASNMPYFKALLPSNYTYTAIAGVSTQPLFIVEQDDIGSWFTTNGYGSCVTPTGGIYMFTASIGQWSGVGHIRTTIIRTNGQDAVRTTGSSTTAAGVTNVMQAVLGPAYMPGGVTVTVFNSQVGTASLVYTNAAQPSFFSGQRIY